MTLTYNGPFESVRVVQLDGREVVCNAGESCEITDETTAAELIERGEFKAE